MYSSPYTKKTNYNNNNNNYNDNDNDENSYNNIGYISEITYGHSCHLLMSFDVVSHTPSQSLSDVHYIINTMHKFIELQAQSPTQQEKVQQGQQQSQQQQSEQQQSQQQSEQQSQQQAEQSEQQSEQQEHLHTPSTEPPIELSTTTTTATTTTTTTPPTPPPTTTINTNTRPEVVEFFFTQCISTHAP